MSSIRIRRVVAVFALAAATSFLPLSDLHAAPRGESRGGERPERGIVKVIRQSPIWHFLRGLWEEAGARIDDNG